MSISLDDKNILVTGGARGIGKACALNLSEAGGRLAIADIDFEAALAATSKIENARAYRCDFGDPLDIGNIHRQIREDTKTGID